MNACTVRVIELYLSDRTLGPAQGAGLPPGVTSAVRRVLSFGTDFTAEVSSDIDSGGKWLKITPLKPSGGAIRTGCLALLTDGITDIALRRARPSTTYATFRAAPADCSTVTDPTGNAVCRLTGAHLQIGQAVGVDPATVVSSWSFTTQSINDTFVVLDQPAEAQPIGDPGDPINHVCECVPLRTLHLIKVNGDQVVPNSATDRLITPHCSVLRQARPRLPRCSASRCCSPPRRCSRADRSS